MRTVEITRDGNAPVLDQLAEMRQWLRQMGIKALELEAVRIVKARVSFRARFATDDEAERFCRRFDTSGETDPG